MKKTSPRNLTKAARPNRIKSRQNQHDTPPTLTFNDGSFEIESKTKLNEAGSGPWFYTSTVGETDIQHIRVIHGSGEMVYQNLEANGSTIILELKKKDDAATVLNSLIITGDSNAVTIKSDRQLAAAEKTKGRRKFKRIHPGADTDEFRIERIRIENSNNSFEVKPARHLDYFSEEYRVLVWLE